MYKQVLDPVGDSLFYSWLLALIPIVTLFVLLGGLRWAAHNAALVALGLSILIAIIVYGCPWTRRCSPLKARAEHREVPGELGHVVDPDRRPDDPHDREDAEGGAL